MNDSQEEYQFKDKIRRTARYEMLSVSFHVRCVVEFLSRLNCYSYAVLLEGEGNVNIWEPIGLAALCSEMDGKQTNVEWCMGG